MDSKTRGQADEDCLFLENVLDKLYDFGNRGESKKRLKSQKKKKRKRCEELEEEDEEEESSVAENCSTDTRADHPKQLKPEQAGPSSQNQVEVIVFQDPGKKQRTKEPPAPPTPQKPGKTQSDQPEELNLEKARLEVHRFGITGFKKEQQRVFEQDRAVMLGARPPRREYVNYKILQQQIKEKKQRAKEDVQPDLKIKKKQKSEKDRKTATSGLGAAPTGQMGRFKNGMLILSSSEIQKIKGRKWEMFPPDGGGEGRAEEAEITAPV